MIQRLYSGMPPPPSPPPSREPKPLPLPICFALPLRFSKAPCTEEMELVTAFYRVWQLRRVDLGKLFDTGILQIIRFSFWFVLAFLVTRF